MHLRQDQQKVMQSILKRHESGKLPGTVAEREKSTTTGGDTIHDP